MLVRRMAMKNIRSYNDGEETAIEFPEGTTLFEGDIGSGKSTLLYALEFALFGFSDMKGSHLLSEGKSDGSVSVTFDSGGTEFRIDRHLRARGEDVVQDECFITSRGERTRLSASDLKERVVSILGFNEPTHPKAESLVYRYAVFTPQEQMKEILTQNSEDRLHVVRRVLGAQSYQIAADNSEVVERKVKDIARDLKRSGDTLEEKLTLVRSNKETIARLQSEIPRLKQEVASASKAVRSLDTEWKETLEERQALAKVEAKLPLLKQGVSDLSEDIRDRDDSLASLEAQLNGEYNPIVKSFEGIPEPASTEEEVGQELKDARNRLTTRTGAKLTLETELSKSLVLIAKGVCPYCGQKVSRDLSERTEHSQRELEEVSKEVDELASSVDALEAELSSVKDYRNSKAEYERAKRNAQRAELEISRGQKKQQASNKKLAAKMAELAEGQARSREMAAVSQRLDELETKLESAREQDKQSSLRLNQGQTELSTSLKEREQLEEEVRKLQRAVDESIRLGRYQSWISSFFRPTVKLIERQTLAQAASRFTEHFQRFFTTLIDDPDMVVRVDENFTPLFEREGFEQDYDALSGGERTSMAIAYRFALNSVVRESVLAQPELVILDEPTDGFSKEQIYKMRDLLGSLGSRQIILVSHERELESMADHVFRVEKRNGSSIVRALEVSPAEKS